jgi:hypothetical protein
MMRRAKGFVGLRSTGGVAQSRRLSLHLRRIGLFVAQGSSTAVLAGMIVLIHVSWLLVGASLARVLRDPFISRTVNVALAGILVVTSLIAVLPS